MFKRPFGRKITIWLLSVIICILASVLLAKAAIVYQNKNVDRIIDSISSSVKKVELSKFSEGSSSSLGTDYESDIPVSRASSVISGGYDTSKTEGKKSNHNKHSSSLKIKKSSSETSKGQSSISVAEDSSDRSEKSISSGNPVNSSENPADSQKSGVNSSNIDTSGSHETSASVATTTDETNDYRTDISYDQLLNNENNIFNSKIELSGEVLKIINNNKMIFSVQGNDSKKLLIVFDNITQPIVEGDDLTLYGIYKGTVLESDTKLPQIEVQIMTNHSGKKW